MNHYDKINDTKNIFLTSIHEPEDNVLEFTLTLGKVEQEDKTIFLPGLDPIQGREIYHDSSSESFLVRFENYICYSVINESYDGPSSGTFKGNRIRVYSESKFLEYVKKDTLAESLEKGNYNHYCFISNNHIVNVISIEEPLIAESQ